MTKNSGDVYLVHGWKAAAADLKTALADMPPKAFDHGLRVVFSEKSMVHAFLGEVVLTVPDGDGFAAGGAPGPADVERIRKELRALGLEGLAVEQPKLWVVRG